MRAACLASRSAPGRPPPQRRPHGREPRRHTRVQRRAAVTGRAPVGMRLERGNVGDANAPPRPARQGVELGLPHATGDVTCRADLPSLLLLLVGDRRSLLLGHRDCLKEARIRFKAEAAHARARWQRQAQRRGDATRRRVVAHDELGGHVAQALIGEAGHVERGGVDRQGERGALTVVQAEERAVRGAGGEGRPECRHACGRQALGRLSLCATKAGALAKRAAAIPQSRGGQARTRAARAPKNRQMFRC